jgi:hypothetical protein
MASHSFALGYACVSVYFQHHDISFDFDIEYVTFRLQCLSYLLLSYTVYIWFTCFVHLN